MWRASLVLLCLAAGSRQLSITELVVPAAVEAGEDATLQCKYNLLETESVKNLFVKWWWTPYNSSDQRYQLYQRIAGHQAEVIHHHHQNIEIAENDGIRLVNVTTNNSGIYECEVSDIDEVREHKKLVVFSFGTGPLLNVSLEEDNPEEQERTVLVTCEAVDVAPYPDISITLNGEKVNSLEEVTQQEDGLYAIHGNATLPLDEADDGEFRCELLYEDDDVPHAPNVVSQSFKAPTAFTPEPESSGEPSPAASEPDNNGSNLIGESLWMLLTSYFVLYCVVFN